MINGPFGPINTAILLDRYIRAYEGVSDMYAALENVLTDKNNTIDLLNGKINDLTNELESTKALLPTDFRVVIKPFSIERDGLSSNITVMEGDEILEKCPDFFTFGKKYTLIVMGTSLSRKSNKVAFSIKTNYPIALSSSSNSSASKKIYGGMMYHSSTSMSFTLGTSSDITAIAKGFPYARYYTNPPYLSVGNATIGDTSGKFFEGDYLYIAIKT